MAMMILGYYNLNWLVLQFSRYLPTSQILTFVSYLEKIFFLGYHSRFISLSWINKISSMAENEEQASKRESFYSI